MKTTNDKVKLLQTATVTPSQRRELLNTPPPRDSNIIFSVEGAHNILKKNLPLSRQQFAKLKHKASQLRRLANHKGDLKAKHRSSVIDYYGGQ